MARLTHKQSSLFEDAPDHIARKQLSRKRYAALQNRKERERPISLHPLTDTVWLKIIGLLDAPSAVCFALTCHRVYNYVTWARQGTPKHICPPPRTGMTVFGRPRPATEFAKAAQHEQLMRQLWHWMPFRYRGVVSRMGMEEGSE